jgi:hypothetical protein
MQLPKPNWIWFVSAYICGLVVACVISLHILPETFLNLWWLDMAGRIALIPIGLGVFVKFLGIHNPSGIILYSTGIFCYVFYIVVIIKGSLTKSRNLWIILVLALLLNIYGCLYFYTMLEQAKH